jgi:hypothetical protein
MVPRTSYALEVHDICNIWMDDTRASEVRIPRVCHMLPEQHPGTSHADVVHMMRASYHMRDIRVANAM